MRWFLQLFPQYRALLDRLQELTRENAILNDRIQALEEERQKVWRMTETALAGERTAYQSALNVHWQQRGFGAPYPEAPHLPPTAVPHQPSESTVPRREIGSERVARLTGQFIQHYAERMSTPE